jgi:anti-sigma B factor antagonist
LHQGGTAWPVGHIRARQAQGVTVVEFRGEVDIAAADSILPELDAATEAPAQTVVIDLTPVRFFGCYGLRLLCRAEQRVAELGGRLLLVCPHPLTLRILRAGGLIGRFAPVPTLDEALALTGSSAAR